MALDGWIYCDCFEKGRIRTPPPQPALTYVNEEGCLTLANGSTDADWKAFYSWRKSACEHGPWGQLVSHRLGNIALIAFLRFELSRHAQHFPVLLAKVVYDGVHGGDFLSLRDVEQVAVELGCLSNIHVPDERDESIIREFEGQMRELVNASRLVGKPIVF